MGGAYSNFVLEIHILWLFLKIFKNTIRIGVKIDSNHIYHIFFFCIWRIRFEWCLARLHTIHFTGRNRDFKTFGGTL